MVLSLMSVFYDWLGGRAVLSVSLANHAAHDTWLEAMRAKVDSGGGALEIGVTLQ